MQQKIQKIHKRTHRFVWFLAWGDVIFNIRDVWGRNMTRVSDNRHKGRKETQKSQEREEQRVQKHVWCPQTKPIFYKTKNCCFIHKSLKYRHCSNFDWQYSSEFHWNCFFWQPFPTNYFALMLLSHPQILKTAIFQFIIQLFLIT